MRLMIVIVVSLVAVLPASARAQTEQPQPPADSPTERLQEGALAIIEGLRMMIDQLQSYQPPEVLPNGDIIIRKRPPESEKPDPDAKPSPEESKPHSL